MKRESQQYEGIRVLDEFVCQAIPDPSLAPVSLQVEILWPGASAKDLLFELGQALPEEHREQVSLSVKPKRGVVVGEAVLGAIIQGGAVVFAALLSAWLTWPKLPKPKGASVVLTTPDGKRLGELPIDASPGQIKQIVSGAGNAQKIRMKLKMRK